MSTVKEISLFTTPIEELKGKTVIVPKGTGEAKFTIMDVTQVDPTRRIMKVVYTDTGEEKPVGVSENTKLAKLVIEDEPTDFDDLDAEPEVEDSFDEPEPEVEDSFDEPGEPVEGLDPDAKIRAAIKEIAKTKETYSARALRTELVKKGMTVDEVKSYSGGQLKEFVAEVGGTFDTYNVHFGEAPAKDAEAPKAEAPKSSAALDKAMDEAKAADDAKEEKKPAPATARNTSPVTASVVPTCSVVIQNTDFGSLAQGLVTLVEAGILTKAEARAFVLA